MHVMRQGLGPPPSVHVVQRLQKPRAGNGVLLQPILAGLHRLSQHRHQLAESGEVPATVKNGWQTIQRS